MNDAEIMELVDEVRRCERAVQQAKNDRGGDQFGRGEELGTGT